MLGVIEKLVSRRQLFLRTKAYNLTQSLKARDMVAATSCSWLTLPSKTRDLSLASSSSSSSSISNPASLSFCRSISHSHIVFSQGSMSLSSVSEAATKEKVDSVVKRGRQAKNRCNNNRARKSLIKS